MWATVQQYKRISTRGVVPSKDMTKGIIAVVLSLALVLAVFLGGSILLRNARASVAQNRGEAFVAKLYAE